MSLNPLNRKQNADIHYNYRVKVQLGVALSLLLFIGLFNINFDIDSEIEFTVVEQDVIEMEEIVRTDFQPPPPPPPRPPMPVSVPDDAIVDDSFDFDAMLDFDDTFDLPPPPPPADADEEDDEPEIFVMVEQMPELIGGIAELQRHVRYPEIARKAGVEGRVVVQFIIDEQGNVQDPFVVRGIGAGADEAALHAVRQVRFTPGMQRGRPVKVQYTIPVQFRLTKAD